MYVVIEDGKEVGLGAAPGGGRCGRKRGKAAVERELQIRETLLEAGEATARFHSGLGETEAKVQCS